MTKRMPLPPQLGSSFTIGEGRDAGLGRSRLRAADLTSPFWGVRARGEAPARDALRALLRRLPEHVFLAGLSAAAVHGVPLWREERARIEAGVRLGVPRGYRAVERAGVNCRTLSVRPEDVTTSAGLRVTSAARTWFDLACEVAFDHLVAMGDALVNAERPGRISVTDLADIVAANPHTPGVAAARRAIELVSEFAESPAESVLRVLLHTAELPGPEVNVSLWDGNRFLARVDLLFRDYGVVVEYEGSHHGTDLAQWRRDMTRIGDLQAHGYLVERVHANDLAAPHPLLRRLEKHLRSRGWTGRVRLP